MIGKYCHDFNVFSQGPLKLNCGDVATKRLNKHLDGEQISNQRSLTKSILSIGSIDLEFLQCRCFDSDNKQDETTKDFFTF